MILTDSSVYLVDAADSSSMTEYRVSGLIKE